jgi:p-hydroxybenzoate 3-monooxygenase
LRDDGQILFEVDEVSIGALLTSQLCVRFRYHGETKEISSDWLAGCDGFHGVCRPSIPPEALKVFEKTYPFA